MSSSIDSLVLSSVRSSSTSTAKTNTDTQSSAERLGQAARLSATPDSVVDQAALVLLSGNSGDLTGAVNASIAVGGPDISGFESQGETAESVAGQDFKNIIRTATSSIVSGTESDETDAASSNESADGSSGVDTDSSVDDSDSSSSGVSVGADSQDGQDDSGSFSSATGVVEGGSLSSATGVVLDEQV